MRILYVHERLGALGGAEANARITAESLKERGHSVGCLHGPGTGKGEEQWKQAFNFLYPLEGWSEGRLLEVIKEFQPDIFYIHKMPDLQLIELLLKTGVPMVRMVHDHDIYCMRSYKYHYFSRKICTRAASWYCLFPCAGMVVKNHGAGLPVKFLSFREKLREIRLNQQFDRMVVVSNYMREELLKNGFDGSRIEIHPPVPRMPATNIQSSFSDRNLIIYAGQIIRGKGVDVLIRALAQIKTHFECVVLGDGNHKRYCEELVQKLGLSNRVKFEGFIPQEKLTAYYKDCSVIALSSVWPEPIATIGLEVMRYGLPVVAFDAGGIRDWLKDGENGFLVPWMKIDDYAARLEQLLNDKELARRMGKNGLNLVNSRYHYSSYILDLEEMFERVIASKSTTSEPRLRTSRGSEAKAQGSVLTIAAIP
ncbi:MAG: glycosyltransferase family 4 protein [Verrucomicrobiota bacterium]|nr:glycosyltransferase family 4 protein [Verrucomicrobiota bacterium]